MLQVPGATPVWLNVAGIHAVVRWHVLQAPGVIPPRCPAGMPRDSVLLWQVEQGVAATTVWFIVAGTQALVRWQLSQATEALVPPLWFVGCRSTRPRDR